MTVSMTFLELGVACGCTPRGLWAGDLHAGSTGRADPEPRGTALAPRQSREAVTQPRSPNQPQERRRTHREECSKGKASSA